MNSCLQRKATHAKELLLKKSVNEGKWRVVLKIIASNNNLGITSESQGRCSPLMYACKYDPPLNVITALLKGNPSAAYETDGKNNLPLHIACQYGASPGVIKALIEANEDATTKKNINGMLPIHKACRYYLQFSRKSKPGAIILCELKEILQKLLSVEPASILEEDDNGMCPIEHALEGYMHVDILTLLQSKAEAERMKYDASCASNISVRHFERSLKIY